MTLAVPRESYVRIRVDAALRDSLPTLERISYYLSQALDEPEIWSVLLSAGLAALDAACGMVWLSRTDGSPAIAAAQYKGGMDLASLRAAPLEAPVPIREVIRSGLPFMISSTAEPASPSAHSARVLFRSWLILPLIILRRTVGAVSFSFLEERSVDQGSRTLLENMITLASRELARR